MFPKVQDEVRGDDQHAWVTFLAQSRIIRLVWLPTARRLELASCAAIEPASPGGGSRCNAMARSSSIEALCKYNSRCVCLRHQRLRSSRGRKVISLSPRSQLPCLQLELRDLLASSFQGAFLCMSLDGRGAMHGQITALQSPLLAITDCGSIYLARTSGK